VLKQVKEEKGSIKDKLGQVEGMCQTFSTNILQILLYNTNVLKSKRETLTKKNQ